MILKELVLMMMMMMMNTNYCYDDGDDVVSIILYFIGLYCVDDVVCMYCVFVAVLMMMML